jgi:hypothetical protein
VNITRTRIRHFAIDDFVKSVILPFLKAGTFAALICCLLEEFERARPRVGGSLGR